MGIPPPSNGSKLLWCGFLHDIVHQTSAAVWPPYRLIARQVYSSAAYDQNPSVSGWSFVNKECNDKTKGFILDEVREVSKRSARLKSERSGRVLLLPLLLLHVCRRSVSVASPREYH